MNRFTLSTAFVVALSATSLAQTKSYLNIGDPAPKLEVQKWLKGQPVSKFEPGQIYVVEFWATWCGPCKENIPHLTEMAAKYKGKASILGISIWENTVKTNSDYLGKVASFVKDQGSKMDYNIAVDKPKQPVADAWMRAAGEGGIPTSFIVGRDGKIAWIGHPANLEKVLVDVIENRFDVQAARDRRTADVEVVRPIQEAMTNKKFAVAIELIDKAISKDPKAETRYFYDRLVALYHTDPAAAQARSEEILKEAEGNIGAYRMVGSIFAAEADLSPEAYAYGQGVIEAALAKNEMRTMFLAMKAAVLDHRGQRAAAIEGQKEAIKSAETDPNITKEFLNFLRENLAKMEKGG